MSTSKSSGRSTLEDGGSGQTSVDCHLPTYSPRLLCLPQDLKTIRDVDRGSRGEDAVQGRVAATIINLFWTFCPGGLGTNLCSTRVGLDGGRVTVFFDRMALL